ncbi:MAG: acetate/propionate family kinase [Verrucomicrobiia bacterium]
MNILVFNCGSSSLKYRLLAMPEAIELTGGEAQRVGPPTAKPSVILYHVGKEKFTKEVPMANHAAAFEEVMKLLMQDEKLRPDAVGHRLVHGGTFFRNPTVVTGDVMQKLEAIRDLAPLHNPPAMALMYACQERYPALPQVAVFDTAFHGTIPEKAYTYALPGAIRDELGIRKYGFHGTSHQFVMEEAAAFLKKPVAQFNAVSCHLGSGGASLCAIVNGQSVDNTMGYSPLQGLVMSTRCGDLDPAVTMQLLAQTDGDGQKVLSLLNNKSGVLGLTGSTADIRDVLANPLSATGEKSARLTQTEQVYVWRLRKYLGAYLAVVGQPDAVIFTDTIGETVPQVRWAMCADMAAFGMKMDAKKNAHVTQYPTDVAAADSAVRILVVQTNEELAIARRTFLTLDHASPALEREAHSSSAAEPCEKPTQVRTPANLVPSQDSVKGTPKIKRRATSTQSTAESSTSKGIHA